MHFVIDPRQKNRGRVRGVGVSIGLGENRLLRSGGLAAREPGVGCRLSAEEAGGGG